MPLQYLDNTACEKERPSEVTGTKVKASAHSGANWGTFFTCIGKYNRQFQSGNEYTDKKVKNKTTFSWNRRHEYIYVSLDKKGVEEFSFSYDGNEFSKRGKQDFLADNTSLNWTEDVIDFESTARLCLSSKDVVKRLKGFSSLRENWDSYGASPIEWSTISKAIELFSKIVFNYLEAPVPFVAPSPDGSIHFEWEMCSKELRHLIPYEGCPFFRYKIIDKSTGVLNQNSDKVGDIDSMFDVFASWFDRDRII